jgi:hypothetical protein
MYSYFRYLDASTTQQQLRFNTGRLLSALMTMKKPYFCLIEQKINHYKTRLKQQTHEEFQTYKAMVPKETVLRLFTSDFLNNEHNCGT